jgi:hypothetical protein
VRFTEAVGLAPSRVKVTPLIAPVTVLLALTNGIPSIVSDASFPTTAWVKPKLPEVELGSLIVKAVLPSVLTMLRFVLPLESVVAFAVRPRELPLESVALLMAVASSAYVSPSVIEIVALPAVEVAPVRLMVPAASVSPDVIWGAVHDV